MDEMESVDDLDRQSGQGDGERVVSRTDDGAKPTVNSTGTRPAACDGPTMAMMDGIGADMVADSRANSPNRPVNNWPPEQQRELGYGWWMPNLVQEPEPGEATPSALPHWERPRMTTAFGFDPGGCCPGWRFSFFRNNSSTSHHSLSSCLFLDHDSLKTRPSTTTVLSSRDEPLPPSPSPASLLQPLNSFYLSPTVSRSSIVSSLEEPVLDSCDSEPTSDEIIMPSTAAFDASADRFLASSRMGYGSVPGSRLESRGSTSTNATGLRPHSAASSNRASERAGNPLLFSRWTKKHQAHHRSPSRNGNGSSSSNGNGNETSTHRWRELSRPSTERKANPKVKPKRLTRVKDNDIESPVPQTPAMPQMTREEFEALPLAIQRKYFSTLERLRFAQESCLIDEVSQHYNDITNYRHARRRSVSESHSSRSDSPSLAPEESAEGSPRDPGLGARSRSLASEISDTTDKAVYRGLTGSRNSSLLNPPESPPSSARRHSMDSCSGPGRPLDRDGEGEGEGYIPPSFYDSFRWLDEEENLDLRLYLDDYHANLRESVVSGKQRPSFRRHLSINKLPFGRRNSLSATRPATNDAAITATSSTTTTRPVPSSSPAPDVASPPMPAPKRKSRALSLITPKHSQQPSISAFDPTAAHYQDPEARLKLRVYLASPQKFDEAVRFGFPSTDVLFGNGSFLGNARSRSRQHNHFQQDSDGSLKLGGTFLADDDDDNLTLNSDQPSVAEPDSPKTPEPFESANNATPKPSSRHHHHARYASADVLGGSGKKFLLGDGPDVYTQVPASSREMTLRMTLTRPDLRSPHEEEEIYGWQQRQYHQQHRAFHQHSRRPTALAASALSSEGYHYGDYRWNGSAGSGEKGVNPVKRIWNRVRRG